jgi:hypothetical protein
MSYDSEIGWTRLPPRKRDLPKYGSRLSAPKCESCGSGMRIKRREAHPELGPKYELQTFACINCGHLRTRKAESPGAE